MRDGPHHLGVVLKKAKQRVVPEQVQRGIHVVIEAPMLDSSDLSGFHNPAEIASFLKIGQSLRIIAVVIKNDDVSLWNAGANRLHTVAEILATIE